MCCFFFYLYRCYCCCCLLVYKPLMPFCLICSGVSFVAIFSLHWQPKHLSSNNPSINSKGTKKRANVIKGISKERERKKTTSSTPARKQISGDIFALLFAACQFKNGNTKWKNMCWLWDIRWFFFMSHLFHFVCVCVVFFRCCRYRSLVTETNR